MMMHAVPMIPPSFSPLLCSSQAPYDMDNLLLGELPGKRADAEYDLEALMLTGSCIDYAQGQNRGVRLTLLLSCIPIPPKLDPKPDPPLCYSFSP